MDNDVFESPKILVEGAKESLLDFESRSSDFVKTCKHEVVAKLDNKSGQKIIIARFSQKIPGKVRLLASGIVNDLRHALDQSVSAAAVCLGRSDSKGVYFPIGKSIDDLSRDVKTKCANVHPALVAHLLTFKPHFAEGADNVLWGLSRMAASNKHRQILGLSAKPTGLQLNNGLFVGNTSLGLKWSHLKNEAEIARVDYGSQVQMDFSLSLQIIINDAEVFARKPAADVFRDLTTKVEHVVLSIETETGRIRGI
jgi:hypothetical protein